MKAYVVALSAIFLAAPALALEPGAAGNSGAVSNSAGTTGSANVDGGHAPDVQRLICRQIEASSESRLGPRRSRVCRTAEEWREAQRRD